MMPRLEALVQRGQEVYMYTPVLYQHSFQSITSQLETFLAFNAIVYQPEKVAELHEMRINAKRLRYTIETFSGLYANQLKPYLQAVRSAQDMLGDIHDCDVWQVFLPLFLEEERARIKAYYGHERPYKRLVPGILALREDRQQKRAALYQEFLDAWQRWQGEKVWAELRATIQVPFLQLDMLYPPADRVRDQGKAGPGPQEG
jgi:CHAD domain-containing protein